MTSPVTLINVFAVPKGKEEEFIKTWNETGELLKKAPRNPTYKYIFEERYPQPREQSFTFGNFGTVFLL